jgi:catechol 2,3-dioxygenase-like lactoylglutathione lyase family enzyme
MTSSNDKTRLAYRIENITPILSIRDMAASRQFYMEKLGFREAEWGDDNFTSINRDNRGLYLCKGEQGNPGTWIWIGFDGDIFALYEELKTKGVKVKQPPTNHPWAIEMQIEDPDGHVLRFGTDPIDDQAFLDR